MNILAEVKKSLIETGINVKEIVFVDHHLAHAASAYYLGPWNLDEEILVFTADGKTVMFYEFEILILLLLL